MNYYLAIDQGTFASRASLFNLQGQLIYQHKQGIKLNRISESHVEQDADEILGSVKSCLSQVFSFLKTTDKITACGLATQRSSVLAWQSNGEAISPVLSWQDTRGYAQIKQLAKYDNEIRSLTGLPLSAHYGASKLHYLLQQNKHNTHPETSLQLSPLVSYLLYHLLDGQPYIIDHANAQRSQLFDLEDLQWSSRLCELFNIPVKLLPQCVPVIRSIERPHGFLRHSNIPVTAINGDQSAAIFADGLPGENNNNANETAVINIGTGAFILCLQETCLSSKEQLTGIACSAQNNIQYTREATINGAASALKWLEQNEHEKELWRRLPAWLAQINQPPVFINTIGGLASPWWQTDIAPRFIYHNNHQTGLAEKTVAIVESIIFMLCLNLQIIEREQKLTTLKVSGGLAALNGLCQRLASLSGKTVIQTLDSEMTSRGIAWLAADNRQDWQDSTVNIFQPEQPSENLQALQKRYQLFQTTLKTPGKL